MNKKDNNMVNEALLHELAEDQEDLETFKKRAPESTISYESFFKKIKADGKI